MKLWEAMKALEEGKKVRSSNWDKNEYVVMDPYTKRFVYGSDGRIAHIYTAYFDWELYDERKPADELTKDLYDIVYNMLKADDISYDEYLETIDAKDHDNTYYLYNLYHQLRNMNKLYKLDEN